MNIMSNILSDDFELFSNIYKLIAINSNIVFVAQVQHSSLCFILAVSFVTFQTLFMGTELMKLFFYRQ